MTVDDTEAPGAPPPVVRTAERSEFERLRWIELESDRLLEEFGVGPFPDDEEGGFDAEDDPDFGPDFPRGYEDEQGYLDARGDAEAA